MSVVRLRFAQPIFVFVEFASVAINRFLWYHIDNEKRASMKNGGK